MLEKTVVSILILLQYAASLFAAGAVCPIIPLPKEYYEVGENFNVSGNSVIVYGEGLDGHAYFLQKEMMKFCGIALSVDKSQPKDDRRNVPVIRMDYAKGYASEAYSLKMRASMVEMEASDDAGMKYAIMSFLQLARLSEPVRGSVSIPCWEIKDAPEYSWRGLMLDESRHFFGAAKVKQILDWMALYRMNRFHWHLTDSQGWRIEIKGYPRLAYVGGIGNYSDRNLPAEYYTQDRIREIVSYAAERNISVIPEIDMPGHASAAVRAYPEFSGGGSPKYPDYTFNPGKDTVYSFLTAVLKEVDALFPSQVIHLGGDEVHYGNEDWKTDKDIQDLFKREKMKELSDVETYFFARMADSLLKLNNDIAAWDEVANSDFPPEKTIIFFWRHDRTEQLQKAFDKGYGVVMSPRIPMYLDYPQDTIQAHGVDWRRFPLNTYRKIYDYDPMEYDVNYPEDARILGIQANLWTERVVTPNRLDYMLFPRLAALAEVAWSPSASRDIGSFENRLKSQFALYEKDKIYYLNVFNPRLTGEPVD